MEVL
jgi:hypothetical protein